MTKTLPYLALDSAGKRTILNDYSLPMFGGITTKKETKKMGTTFDGAKYGRLFAQDMRAANRYWTQCHGRNIAADAAMETAGKLKEFLKTKLSPGDHAQVCDMLDGDAEAQHAGPPPDDVDAKPRGQLAGDAKARDGFYARFPDAARIRIDNSGIQPSRRPASYSEADAKSFYERYPDAKRIKLA